MAASSSCENMRATSPSSAPIEDHRVRVAAQRREKTRLKLLESALAVLHEKGPDSVVADDFIAAAGVSRGTFYNYFDTTNDLIQALATAMGDEFVAAVNACIVTSENPLKRMATGIRLYMSMALKFPFWGRFLTRVGVHIAVRGQPIEQYITRDLTDARDAGLISVKDVLVARDMIIGSMHYGIGTMVTEPAHANYPDLLVEGLLRGFRADEALIQSLAFDPLPPVASIDSPLFSKIRASKSRKRKA